MGAKYSKQKKNVYKVSNFNRDVGFYYIDLHNDLRAHIGCKARIVSTLSGKEEEYVGRIVDVRTNGTYVFENYVDIQLDDGTNVGINLTIGFKEYNYLTPPDCLGPDQQYAGMYQAFNSNIGKQTNVKYELHDGTVYFTGQIIEVAPNGVKITGKLKVVDTAGNTQSEQEGAFWAIFWLTTSYCISNNACYV